MRWLRRVLFKGSLATLCLLIASLPQPDKQAWKALLRQRGCHDKAYKQGVRQSPGCSSRLGRPLLLR
jgi:hypothetical protein